MKFIRQFLRSVLLSESELAALQENQKKPLNITKDTTMELIQCGPTLSNIASKVSLANLPDVKRMVAETAISDLFTKKHFSICTVDAVLEIVGTSRNTTAYKELRALHCVDYVDMPPQLLEILPNLLNECFKGKRTSHAARSSLEGIF